MNSSITLPDTSTPVADPAIAQKQTPWNPADHPRQPTPEQAIIAQETPSLTPPADGLPGKGATPSALTAMPQSAPAVEPNSAPTSDVPASPTPAKRQPSKAEESAREAQPGVSRAPMGAKQPNPVPGPGVSSAPTQAEIHLDTLNNRVFPELMSIALPSLKGCADSDAYSAYLVQFIEEAGNPKDPIERKMLQLMALCHFQVGQSFAAGANAKEHQLVKSYHTSGIKLLAEFRLLVTALQAYRAANHARQQGNAGQKRRGRSPSGDPS
jgi:hypothetical protein